MANVEDLKIDRTMPLAQRKSRRSWIGLLSAMLGLLLAGGWFVRDQLPISRSQRPAVTNPAPAPVDARRETGNGSGFSAGGYLEVVPPGPYIISIMIEGRVKSISVIEGLQVAAGQEIAKLDDTLYRQDVMAREAAAWVARTKLTRLEAGYRSEEIKQAEADLVRAQARLHQAQADQMRNEELARIGAVPDKIVVASETAVATTEADVASRKAELDLRTAGTRKEDIAIARAEVAAANAELERANWRLNACVIRAPIAGVVLERFVEVGSWVSPHDGRQRAGAVVSIMDPKKIQAWADVNQRDLGRVFVGQMAILATDAQPGREIEGRVLRILPKANLQKNTVQAKIEIFDPPADLRPETSVKVTFLPPKSATEARDQI